MVWIRGQECPNQKSLERTGNEMLKAQGSSFSRSAFGRGGAPWISHVRHQRSSGSSRSLACVTGPPSIIRVTAAPLSSDKGRGGACCFRDTRVWGWEGDHLRLRRRSETQRRDVNRESRGCEMFHNTLMRALAHPAGPEQAGGLKICVSSWRECDLLLVDGALKQL